MSATNSGSSQQIKMAKDDFENALRKGFWRSVFSWFNQSKNELLPFDEVRRILPIHGQYYLGLRQIQVESIIGSVGRYNDFDRVFLPRRRQTSGRWVSVDLANIQDIILPPIEVYKVGNAYFVKDGNHRVSVARQRGQKFVDAYITEVSTNLEINENSNIDEIIMLQEQAYFLEQTNIKALRPEAKLQLTLPGQYQKLLEHISVHRWFMGERYQRETTFQEAVINWYDEVYLPLITVIREQNVLKDFPNRTETDLYLWIIEHLWFLREQIHEEISLKDAASHFKTEYSKKPLKRIWMLFRRLARKLSKGLEDPPNIELGILAEELMLDVDPVGSEKSIEPDESNTNQKSEESTS